jgi:3-oxoacyl-[acyl-carrier-protein] synthase II
MGVITPLGNNLGLLWENLLAGKSGIARIAHFDVSAYPTQIGGEVLDFDPLEFMDRKEARRMDRFTQMAVAAANLAVADAHIDFGDMDPERAGVIMGTGIGGIATLCDQHQVFLAKGPGRVSPFFIPMLIGNMGAGQISITHNLHGPNFTTVSACTSSANAVGEAMRAIQNDEADVMVAGGSEATMVPLALAGFCSMKAMSTRNADPERACRPFDRERDGFVLSEGAAVVILENAATAAARGAGVYAEMIGYGATGDAYHIVEPPPDGAGAAAAMARALKDAEIAAQAVASAIGASMVSSPAPSTARTFDRERPSWASISTRTSHSALKQ